MTAREIYSQAYRLLNKVTPLEVDCGKLCDKACCKSGEGEETGMYLFPGESVMYGRHIPDWIKIEKSNFTYGESDTPVQIAFCGGSCNRNLRPLSCRIFPLVPYKRKGEMVQIIVDPRARAACPLANALRFEEYNERFTETVGYVFRILCKNSEIASFIEEFSLLIDEYDFI